MNLRQNTALRRSEESTEQQLALGRAQGETYGEALAAMDDESTSGLHTRRVGEYVIGVAVEEAEGMWLARDGRLVWQDPESENCHVEVAVRSAADGRFLPGLRVTVTLFDSDGREVGTEEQPFLWHPWLYHYGRNWTVPASGTYRVRVRIEPPSFARHDHENGQRFADPVEVDFDAVEIQRARARKLALR